MYEIVVVVVFIVQKLTNSKSKLKIYNLQNLFLFDNDIGDENMTNSWARRWPFTSKLRDFIWMLNEFIVAISIQSHQLCKRAQYYSHNNNNGILALTLWFQMATKIHNSYDLNEHFV